MIDLDKVIYNFPCAVLVVDQDRRVLLSNRSAREFARQNESQIMNKRGGEVLGCVHAEEAYEGCGFAAACRFCKAKNAIEGAFRNRCDVRAFELELDIKAAGRRFFTMTATYLPASARPEAGSAPSVIITIEDITDMKSKERLAAAHETIGAVCHEMNQPLMALMGYVDIMMADGRDDGYLPEMRSLIQRMGDITRRLQSVTKYTTRSYLDRGNRILDIPDAAVQQEGYI